MRNKAAWILVPLTVLVLLFSWKHFRRNQQTLDAGTNTFNIDFVNSPSKNSLSLSVFDSDMLENLVVMEQVVGTLIKYSSTGRYEPYLAKSWSVSEDQRIWTFDFQPNLLAEDGESIDANSFVLNLKKLLKIYSTTYSPPTFNRLIGWDEFIKGNDSKLGIKASSKYQLVLSFESTPSGVLEFLSMPVFGFYSSSNFAGDKWRSKNKIISSGLYKVIKHSNDEVVIETRKEWPIFQQNPPLKIIFRQQPFEQVLKEKKNFVILLPNGDYKENEDFVKINCTPTMLRSFVLSPYVYPFESKEVRKAFRTFVRKKSEEMNYEDASSRKIEHFYNVFSTYDLENRDYKKSVQLLKDLKIKNLSIFKNSSKEGNENKYLNFLLDAVKADLGWTFKIDIAATVGHDWIQKTSSNKNFALRFARVDIGGAPENWAIDMMFCSTLGISFPDADGNVCNIVKKYYKGEYLDKLHYWKDLHAAIENDSTVIPLAISGSSWLISKTIDTSDLSPTMGIPRFDQLKRKE